MATLYTIALPKIVIMGEGEGMQIVITCRYCLNLNLKNGCKCDEDEPAFEQNLPLIDCDLPIVCDKFKIDSIEYCK